MSVTDSSLMDTGIAIVGLSARFPGARNVEEFWQNLRNGIESLERLDEEQLLAAGVDPRTLKDPHYVPVSGSLADVSMFDAGYFGLSPRDAAITDPQHRHFLECAVEAFEHAGHSTHRFAGAIGVFAGCGMNSYFVNNLVTNSEMMRNVGAFLLRHTGNDRDFLPTTVSYKLDLRGPSMAIQTACSTSLVAIHTACQSLLGGECEMAVAGGSTILVPNGHGYFYRENEPVSPDGHCRAFEENSAGTVLGSGVGVVVLRRLEDAIKDGDTIHAVIRGSAVNNDGASKVGYMAPSVEGHANAVAEALAVADVTADTISYIEAHGTGTHVGDPIEISALSRAFRASTDQTQFCRIGSVKTNIGHLDTAAGVASLIKVVKSLEARELAPTLHFKNPNPEIDFASSPFIVNADLRPWIAGETPRRAGVSSLGIGGTNAHIVLEEAPAMQATDPAARSMQVLPLSARSKNALANARENLADWLTANSDASLADAAFTLQEGRDYWEHRAVVTADDSEAAIRSLRDPSCSYFQTSKPEREATGVAFMFSGAGSQFPNMGRELYRREQVFQSAMDQCFALLTEMLDFDLKSLIYPPVGEETAAAAELQRPSRLCPAIVIIEWSMAQLWKSWGIEPKGMIGHSLGEYVVACVAGVMSLKDMLSLVVLRGNLIDQLSGGAMLSLPCSEEEAIELIGEDLDLAAVNSPGLCVASGLIGDVQTLQEQLREREIEGRLVPVNAAGHSRHLDSILEEFHQGVEKITLLEPQIPYISNVTGTWAEATEVTDPNYWVRHLRGTVRFNAGLQELISSDDLVLLEVGPGQTLSIFANQQENKAIGVVPSMGKPNEILDDHRFALNAFGHLWVSGLDVTWAKLRGKHERRRRIPLPSYPFEHKSYWVEPGVAADLGAIAGELLQQTEDIDKWVYGLDWIDTPPPATLPEAERPTRWLVFADSGGLGEKLADALRATGAVVVIVSVADSFVELGEHSYALAPEMGRRGYEQLIEALTERQLLPEKIVHMWGVTVTESFRPGSSFLDRNQECGFYSILYLMQSLGEETDNIRAIDVVTNGMSAVSDKETVLYPEKATILGPVRVIPREYPALTVRSIDLKLETTKPSGLLGWVGLEQATISEAASRTLVRQLLHEVQCEDTSTRIAWRENRRFVENVRSRSTILADNEEIGFRQNGVYMVTGGMGGLGFTLAEHVAKTYGARMVLVGRSEFPPEPAWDSWLETHAEHDATTRKIQAIRHIRERGGDVLPVAADVTDADAMSSVLHQAHNKFGPINGVLHAAAAVSDGVLQTKTKEGAEETFASKLYGTLVLDAVLHSEPLDFMVLFSSTSAIIGLPGQVDYAAANAFLNAFAERRSQLGKRTLALDWGIWKDVGGARAMVQNIRREQVQPNYARRTEHILLGDCTLQDADCWRWDASWNTRDMWVLNEHRNENGIALLPGTGYLEIARAVCKDALKVDCCEILNASFLRPLVVADDTELPVTLELHRDSDAYQLTITTGYGTTEHANMRIRPSRPSEASLDIEALRARCNQQRQVAETGQTLSSSQHAQLGFGPRWSCLQMIGFGNNEAHAELQVNPDHADDLAGFPLHPGMMDIATSCGIPLIAGWKPGSAVFVPLGYGALRISAPLTDKIHVRVVNNPENTFERDLATFNIAISAPDGRVLVEIRDYQMRKLQSGSGFGSLEPTRTAGTINEQATQEASAIENVFLEAYDSGIRLEQGIAALESALASSSGGVTVVCPINIDEWQDRITEACIATADTGVTTYERPDLDSEYEAPRDELEVALVKNWQEFLGVDQIGVHDDFFDLGGHSLIAVRLFARLKKEWGVDWPISMLFDAPNISQFAELLRPEVDSEELAVADGRERPDAESNRKHRFLVNMNKATGTQRKPLFLVAGMFGNVLNLRHLANHLGSDQPVYALQAKGLYGEDEPHWNFVDAARDYIREIRDVQPEGPYLLGGFSGGGVTAFEIAHQLLAAGEEVSALVMLDSIPPHPAWPLPSFTDKLKIQWQRLYKEILLQPKTYLQKRIRWELEKRNPEQQAVEKTTAEFRSDQIEVAFRASLDVYQMRQLSVPISLFRPPLQKTYDLGRGRIANADRQLMEHENWWGPWTSEKLNVTIVPGNHDSMVLEPNVKVLARHVRTVLDEAQSTRLELVGNPASEIFTTDYSDSTEQGVRYAS